MRKNKFLIIFILFSMLLNFTSFYVIVNVMKSIYWNNQIQGDYTQYMRLLDTLKLKLDQIPILFYISVGIAIGVLIMTIWGWVGFEND